MGDQRVVRKTAIQCKMEATYGTDPGTWAATDVVLIKEASFNIDRDVVPRGLIRPYMGASEDLIGTRRMIAKFKVELAGSGTAGTAPAWGPLMRMMGFVETATPGQRVEYSPISDNLESASMRYFIDGVRYTSRGARATGKATLNAYGVPELELEVWGFDTAATVNTIGTSDYSAWQRPLVITDANSADIKLGSTYSAGTFAGGTAYVSEGINIDFGGKLSHRKVLGAESIQIVDRQITGQMTVAMDETTEVQWRTDVNANTLTSVAFRAGSTAGQKIGVFGANVQRVNPQAVERDGMHMIQTDLKFLATANGNDIKFVAY